MRAWVEQHPLRVVLLVGLVVAFAAYGATARRAPDAPGDFVDFGRGGTVKLSPYAESWAESHFDPWTGQPQGWSYTENPHGFGERTEHGPVPPDMVGRWAIPLPLGFALGALVGLTLVSLSRRGVWGPGRGSLRDSSQSA